jgi:protocatechuate 3,4-dioxygenase beta subunit
MSDPTPLARVEEDETTLRGADPLYASPGYRSTLLRAPGRPLLVLPDALADTSGPVFGHGSVGDYESDLTRQHAGEPLGERIIVHGRMVDRDDRPIRNTLIEIWQANAAGRYVDEADPGFMPIDPNFTGAGRCLTDSEGRYEFITIRPAAYTGRSPLFRPAHIHVSVFGRSLGSRLVTQCYFEDDPLLERDPIFLAIPDLRARARLLARFNADATPSGPGSPESRLAYDWDIVLRGRDATPMED